MYHTLATNTVIVCGVSVLLVLVFLWVLLTTRKSLEYNQCYPDVTGQNEMVLLFLTKADCVNKLPKPVWHELILGHSVSQALTHFFPPSTLINISHLLPSSSLHPLSFLDSPENTWRAPKKQVSRQLLAILHPNTLLLT